MGDKSIHEIEESKKRSLRRYRNNSACIDRLEEKLTLLEERISSIKTTNYSGMPRGGIPVTLDDLLSDKADLEGRIGRLKEKGRTLKQSIYEEIDSLEDPLQCEILESYFIDRLSIGDIAENLGYTERRVYALYSKAVRKLAKKTVQ